MGVGIEIFAETAVQINPGSHFKVQLTNNHQLVTAFSGTDEFAFSGLVLKGKRVAASGRSRQYAASGSFLGLGLWEAEEAELVGVPELLENRIRLLCDTDLVTDMSLFLRSFGLKFIYGTKEILFDLPMSCPVLEVTQLRSRKYCLDLTELLRERANKLIDLSS